MKCRKIAEESMFKQPSTTCNVFLQPKPHLGFLGMRKCCALAPWAGYERRGWTRLPAP